MWEGFPLFPEQASSFAPSVDALYLVMVGFSAFFTVGIFIAIFYFAIKYRRRSEDEVPPEVNEWRSLELIWTTVPFLLVIGMLVWGVRLYLHMYIPPEEDIIEIQVVGKRWMWKFQHPEGQAEINHLHVPQGSRIKLVMATEDVIHSFFVPAFRVKQDVVPGRYTMVWFEPTRVGEYHLFCAEYCGSKHSHMIGGVTVMEPAAFQEWLQRNEPDESILVAGEHLFDKHQCGSCHRDTDTRRGPALAGLHGSEVRTAGGESRIADDDYLRESILRPLEARVAGYEPLMPSFAGQLSEEDLFALLTYIKGIDRQ